MTGIYKTSCKRGGKNETITAGNAVLQASVFLIMLQMLAGFLIQSGHLWERTAGDELWTDSVETVTIPEGIFRGCECIILTVDSAVKLISKERFTQRLCIP